jgi:predicted ATPase/DNA-binding XRE family transcriptional regulator
VSASDERDKHASLLAFGQLLKRLRVAADLTQEELAERALVSARSISDLERGSPHRPRRDTIQLLADGLQLSGTEREAFVALARGRSMQAVRQGSGDAPSRHDLPHPPTPIVGRLKETAAITAMSLDPAVRVLTLTGPGGVGKTRLALEAGVRVMAAMPDGAVFVDLAPVRDPDVVLSAIAQALRLVANPEQPLRETVHEALREARLLLLLDNFEQVPEAAVVVADLVAACPSLTMLVTSRTPLHIRAEREYAVGPLALPEPADLAALDALARVPAIELFVRRAEVANPKFAFTPANARDVAEIVVRLDGLPLAIELAATRMKILSPSALLERLEPRLPLLTRGAHDLPLRQQAMRATLDWSHDLLSSDERSLFRRLAVFAGGCTVDAAEWMTEAFVLDLLSDLVDKSLLRVQDDLDDNQRFGMLETIREYGLERLAEAGEDVETRHRHLAWCLDLAERAEPALLGAAQHRWHARLAIEHDNLRVALGWAIARGDALSALRLGVAVYRFWGNHGHYEEGRRWLERALAIAPDSPSAPRGHALIGLGVMLFFQGHYEQAAATWEESLALFQTLGDTRGVAYSYGNLGLVADAREDYPRAIASYEQALALFRELEDPTYIGFMLHNVGLIAYFQGEYARATALFEESLALARADGDETSIAMILGNLGLVAFGEGDVERALALQRAALANWTQVNNKPWLARAVEHFALIAAASGQARRAALLFGAGSGLRADFGGSQPPNDRALNERYVAQARADIGEKAFAAGWAAGAQMALDEAIAYALGQEGA